jgi:7,8-dihydropterin-6-yl-methyl-4-(beta-D-ribofuranosyl)aminobenzene 5'-phosphate synthase
MPPNPIPRRRALLGATAALAMSAVTPPTRANIPPAFTVPAVDTLSLKVLIDSTYDTPVAGTHRFVKIRRTNIVPAGDYRRALHSQWGLSMALESSVGKARRRLLFDFGHTAEALLNNMALMGVDPARQDALVLSHGHYDHFGGLMGYLRRHRARLPAQVTHEAGWTGARWQR